MSKSSQALRKATQVDTGTYQVGFRKTQHSMLHIVKLATGFASLALNARHSYAVLMTPCQAILGYVVVNIQASPRPKDVSILDGGGLEAEEFAARDVPCMGGSFRKCHELSVGMCPSKCNGNPRRKYMCTGRCLADATLNCQKHCH